MRLRNWMVFITAVASLECQGCGYAVDNSRSLTSARREAVEASVRRFASNVARDVTQEGPAAWCKEFADSRVRVDVSTAITLEVNARPPEQQLP